MARVTLLEHWPLIAIFQQCDEKGAVTLVGRQPQETKHLNSHSNPRIGSCELSIITEQQRIAVFHAAFFVSFASFAFSALIAGASCSITESRLNDAAF
jgi:hypothetical protein